MAKDKSKANGGIIREFTESLPVKLTKEELLDRGAQLAAIEEDLTTHRLKFESIKKQFKEREADLEARRSVLATVVRRKEEPRDITVIVHSHPTKDGWVTDTRTDLMEIVRARKAEDYERQEEMDLAEPTR